MIGQQTIPGYLTQVAVLGQPFLWMWLYESDIRFPDRMKYNFYILGFAFILFVLSLGIHIGFYSTILIIQYALLTMAATFLYYQCNPIKEAISLAFLTVFLNSFYWEIPLHLAELLSGPPHIGMLVQLWRLIPAVWLWKKYRFNNTSRRTLASGLLFSVLMNWAGYLRIIPNRIAHPIIRLGCLLMLVKTVIGAELNIIPDMNRMRESNGQRQKAS